MPAGAADHVRASRCGAAVRDSRVRSESGGALAGGDRRGMVGPAGRLLREVIARGIERGEARPDAVGGYAFDAIPAMTMYRSKVCAGESSDQDLEEMIDQLMLPLPRPAPRKVIPHAAAPCGGGATGVSADGPRGVR
ncbi:TetR-like C-terminal domain-containing protein [Streptomyces sp. NPDC001817]|uniref:TetR-like C-terminal domain-containing protein n=1 Tax=Streptomyces sp. NPDC001817 TaxID=3154398 RepID=UPI00332DB306